MTGIYRRLLTNTPWILDGELHRWPTCFRWRRFPCRGACRINQNPIGSLSFQCVRPAWRSVSLGSVPGRRDCTCRRCRKSCKCSARISLTMQQIFSISIGISSWNRPNSLRSQQRSNALDLSDMVDIQFNYNWKTKQMNELWCYITSVHCVCTRTQ